MMPWDSTGEGHTLLRVPLSFSWSVDALNAKQDAPSARSARTRPTEVAAVLLSVSRLPSRGPITVVGRTVMEEMTQWPAARQLCPEDLRGSMSRTVLLADDEPALRQLMARVLAGEGFQVLEARHGREADDLFRRYGDEIDLLITDVRMPFVSGTDLVDELRRRRPQLKVLYVTGYPDERTASEHQLVKPFTRDVFVAAIRDVLSESIER